MDKPRYMFAIMKKRLAILVVIPFTLIVLLLLLLGRGLHGFPVVVCNEDEGFDMPMAGLVNIPQTLIAGLDPAVFKVRTVENLAEAKALFDKGEAKVFLRFPAHLTEDMMIKKDDPSYELPERIELDFADANPLVRVFALSSIARSAAGAIKDIAGDALSLDSLPVPIDAKKLLAGFSQAPSYLILSLLGFVSYVLTGIVSLSTAKSMRGRREELAEAALQATLFFTASFGAAGYVLYLALVGIAPPILGLALPQAAFIASPVVLALLCAAAALAFAAALNAASPGKASMIIPYLVLPLFLGGFLFPSELMPVWLQWLKFLFPPYYGLGASTAMWTGRADASLAWNIIITCSFALGFIALGIVGLKARRGLSPTAKNEEGIGGVS